MRSFITGLVVALLSATVSTTVYAAGNVLLWEQEPTQGQLWANFGTLLDGDSKTFGGEHTETFKPILVDKERGVYATPGQENLGVVLADYVTNKNKPVEKVDAGFGPTELPCEGENGEAVRCLDMDNDSGHMPSFTIASL